MENEFLYMLGVVGAGCAVTFAMRALPFLFFAGRGRALPGWVERFGAVVSPVIIAALIVYSYSGLMWRTAWPYLAGAVTVAVHLWKGNPLASIAAGTAIYMCLVACCGCVSTREIDVGVYSPTIRVKSTGLYLGDDRATPKEVLDALVDAGVRRDRAIHIHIDLDAGDAPEASQLIGYLYRNGYTRPVLVTSRLGASASPEQKRMERRALRQR